MSASDDGDDSGELKEHGRKKNKNINYKRENLIDLALEKFNPKLICSNGYSLHFR